MQSDRPVSVSSPLDPDVLLFYRMTATESLGRLFDFDLDVLSEDHNIKLEDLLGQPMTVHLDLPGGGKRHFHGLVSQLSFLGTIGRHAHYGIQLHPWLWFLTRTADCRIFQNKTVPDIIKEVFKDFGFSDVEDSLSGSYEPWDYCVQYRETAFNFISRMMEQEGIYYYFKHEEDKHTLVLSDSYSSHATVPGYAEIPFYPPEESEESDVDRFLEWRISQEAQATSYTLNDYNFETPKSDIKTTATATKKHSGTDYKMFDYPGEYPDTGVGSEYVKYRMEELKCGYETHIASGTARGLMAGCLFSLTDHPRAEQNKEYLLVSATHTLESAGYESGDAGSGELTYSGSIEAIDAKVPYRTPRMTPKPLVQGPQTAVVVGSSGEEIWTDKYGRVKLQFHWDRYGESNENSSCWVRVAQVWAGKSWGAMHIPRIGQEVIVDFLEGDPDRPIVTGRVYNADQMPPYGLPANQTQSGIKSRSSKGGGGDNFNEIRMEDKKGSEELYIHAEKDRNEVVENNMSTSVGANQTLTVSGNRTKTVTKDEETKVDGSRSETVSKDETITILGTRTEDVTKKETITLQDVRELKIGKGDVVTVLQGNREVTVSTGDHILTAKGDSKVGTQAEAILEAASGRVVTVNAGNYSVKTKGGEIILDASTNLNATAAAKMVVQVGGSQIILEPAKITLASGSGSVVLDAAGVTVTGAMVKMNC